MKYELVIIGGGPAGLSAAMTARNRNLSVCVICGGAADSALYKAGHVTNYPGVPDVSGPALLETMTQQARALGADILHERALSAMPMGKTFGVSAGKEFAEGRALLLATGIAQRGTFPGETDYLGRGVSYCATCDGMLYRGKRAAVIGLAADAPEEAGFLPLTDRDVNTLWGRMNKTVGRVYLTDIYNVIHSEFVPLFNPFQSYFDHLPSWDGVSDPIGDLADTVHVKSDQAEFRDYFRKWFVGILPALLDDTVVNHEILVLIGEQGLYKTTWFNFLLPPELRCYFYTKTNSDRLNKDDLFSLTEFALICFEELDGMRPAELNQLKAMVTMPYVNERAAYGRNKERHPHIASFCGTGNNVQFLTDPTGNRRWLPFEVSQIRDPHLHAIPYELVYSQAYALWKSGFCHWFSQEEIRKLNMHNSRFEVPNLEEDLIRTHFRKPFEGEAGIFVTAADILEQISSCLRYPLSPNKIGRIMAGLEFESIRYKGKRGYITVKKTGEDIDRERRSGALGL